MLIFPLTLNWWLISGKSMSNKGSGLCSRARVRTPSITIVIRWWFITRCRCRFWRRLWISSLCTWPTIKAKKSQGHTCCLTMATKGWPGVKLVNWLLNRSYATQLEASICWTAGPSAAQKSSKISYTPAAPCNDDDDGARKIASTRRCKLKRKSRVYSLGKCPNPKVPSLHYKREGFRKFLILITRAQAARASTFLYFLVVL